MSKLDAVALIAFNQKHEVVRVVISAEYMKHNTRAGMLRDEEVAEVTIHPIQKTWSAGTFHPMTASEEDCR